MQNLIESKRIDKDSQINIELLKKNKIINKSSHKIKILGLGEIKEKVNISADFISKSAKEKIEKAGGSITLKKKD